MACDVERTGIMKCGYGERSYGTDGDSSSDVARAIKMLNVKASGITRFTSLVLVTTIKALQNQYVG